MRCLNRLVNGSGTGQTRCGAGERELTCDLCRVYRLVLHGLDSRLSRSSLTGAQIGPLITLGSPKIVSASTGILAAADGATPWERVIRFDSGLRVLDPARRLLVDIHDQGEARLRIAPGQSPLLSSGMIFKPVNRDPEGLSTANFQFRLVRSLGAGQFIENSSLGSYKKG